MSGSHKVRHSIQRASRLFSYFLLTSCLTTLCPPCKQQPPAAELAELEQVRARIAEVKGEVKSVEDQIQTAPPDLQLPLHQRLAPLDAQLTVLMQEEATLKQERRAASAGMVCSGMMLVVWSGQCKVVCLRPARRAPAGHVSANLRLLATPSQAMLVNL